MRLFTSLLVLTLLTACAAQQPTAPIGQAVLKAGENWKVCIMKETNEFLFTSGDLYQSASAGVEQCEHCANDLQAALEAEGRNPYFIKGYMDAMRKDNAAFAKWYARETLNEALKQTDKQ